MNYIAEPIQRIKLRSLAKIIRKILQVEDRLYIPVISVLENVMPLLFLDFSYEYVSKDEFPDNKHAETDIVNHVIRIREDIYGCNITVLKLSPMFDLTTNVHMSFVLTELKGIRLSL